MDYPFFFLIKFLTFSKKHRFKQHLLCFSYFFYFWPPLGRSWGQVNLGMRINALSWAPLGAILAPLGVISAKLIAFLAQLGGNSA
jgi:hypothetical protein